jgi:hydrogenase maturation protease
MRPPVIGENRPHIVVLGVGNVVRTDDGLGVRALARLSADPRLRPLIDRIGFVDAGTRGIDLINDTSDASHVLVLDAVEVGAPAGTLVALSGLELLRLPGGRTVHHLGVADWMRALLLSQGRLPEVRVLGLQPADTGWGTALSPVLEEAVGRLVDAAVEQLHLWTAVGRATPVPDLHS